MIHQCYHLEAIHPGLNILLHCHLAPGFPKGLYAMRLGFPVAEDP